MDLFFDALSWINPNNALSSNSFSITMNNFNHSNGFTAGYWSTPSLIKNVIAPITFNTSSTAPEGTSFVLFGLSNTVDPVTSNDSIYVTVGCTGGKLAIGLHSKQAGVLTSSLTTTTLPWINGQHIIRIWVDATGNKLYARLINGPYNVVYSLDIFDYSFNRIYMCSSYANGTVPTINGCQVTGSVSYNLGHIYNKNQTTRGNFFSYMSARLGVTVGEADLTVGVPEEGDVKNTKVTLAGTNTDVVSGNVVFEYDRVNISAFRNPIGTNITGWWRLTIAAPFTLQQLLTAYNNQFGMNLILADVYTDSPGGLSSFNNEDSFVLSAAADNLALYGEIYITLYHP